MPPHERFFGSRFPARDFAAGPKARCGAFRRPASLRLDDDGQQIDIVTRRREDAVYFGRGHKPRFLVISLPKVKGFFEAAAAAKRASEAPAHG